MRIMFIQHHGALQQKKEIASGVSHTLSALPIFVMFDRLGRVWPGGAANQTITVTASSGNSWTASVQSGSSYVKIDSVLDGTASGTGNGSFTVDMNSLPSGSRFGEVIIESSAPSVIIDVDQTADEF